MTLNPNDFSSFRMRSRTAFEAAVVCPVCGNHRLATAFSCTAADFHCPACRTHFKLGELLGRVSDDEFEALAELVGGRFADRI